MTAAPADLPESTRRRSSSKVGVVAVATWLAALPACGTAAPPVPAPPQAAVASESPEWVLGPVRTYVGYCDASGVVILPDGRLAVADDEHNVLAIYAEAGGSPQQVIDLTEILALGVKSPEADIEDLVLRGDQLVIVTSHGRRKSGKEAPSRQRVAAARLTVAADGAVTLTAEGAPYTQLVELLTHDPALAPLGLAAAAALSPKVAGGLNVEGVVDTARGELVIGLRSPLHDGQAILVTLSGAPGEAPKVVEQRLLALDGRGVRGMARQGDTIWIAAGAPVDEALDARLYTWKPGLGQAAVHAELGGLNVESLAVLGDGELLVLADDGSREVDGVACKKLKDPTARSFRGARLVRAAR